MLDKDVLDRARRWIEQDPDPETRRELADLLARGDLAELRNRFAHDLPFGTAGLRGLLGAGPARMNRAVCRRTSAGLAACVLRSVPDAARRGVVLGYDGRRLSRELAEEAACTFAGAGLTVHLFEGPIPTPLVSFALLALGAAAGVMITASHNPPQYNGYKVYWEHGAQIAPPLDSEIARAIRAVGPLGTLPVLPWNEVRARSLRLLGREMEERYLAAVQRVALHPGQGRDLSIVYTPLHGVGGRLAREALARAGFDRVTVVPEQAEPDAAFPTVPFPNPEEEGALDCALSLAREIGADLVLANDPDADRLAVAVRRGDELTVLTGDQLGALLGHYLLTFGPGGSERLVVTTVVSSTLLSRIAAAAGVHYAETLTGFKWIWNRALELQSKAGLRFVFGYEEAIGYCPLPAVRDKDGVSAAVLAADLAGYCRSRGQSVGDYLDDLARRFGLVQTLQRSRTLPGQQGREQMEAFMERLRSRPPREVGGHAVVAVRDLKRRVRVGPEGEQPLDLPSSDVLILDLEGGGRIVARPSGTEPKMKLYFQLVEPLGPEEAVPAARERAARRIAALADAFLALST